MADSLYRRLPSVDRLLLAEPVARLLQSVGRPVVLEAAREALRAARAGIVAGVPAPELGELAAEVVRRVEEMERPPLRPVINATGVIVHTNLGRAPLPSDAVAAVAEVCGRYSNLELDLETGERGSRQAHLEGLLQTVTGAEAGLAVNNNAAAVLLCLTVLAQGGEVVVSRGQAVEIGGGFRIPDVLRQSGATLVEVGTTNRTYLSDYEAAIGPQTALLLHVHPSNFRITGFTRSVSAAELAELGRRRGIPVLDDLGSGALLDTAAFGLAHEPQVQESVAAGVTLACFSGDKLLGGPQAGVVVGERGAVERVRRHPLARAVRIDKASLAGLVATLRHYARGDALARVPVWRMISTPLPELEARATAWAAEASGWGLSARVVEARSTVGGGSLPGETLPTAALAIGPGPDGVVSPSVRTVDELAARLRGGRLPVVGRVERGALLLDPRTVLPDEDAELLAMLRAAAGSVHHRDAEDAETAERTTGEPTS